MHNNSKHGAGQKKTYQLALMAVLLSLALILGYVEHLIPIFPSIPGLKLGLSNIVLLLCFYAIGTKQVFLLMFLKVFLSTILFSGLDAMMYSLAGGLCSVLAMTAGKKLLKLSIIGTSVLGGVSHNIAQVVMAMIIIQMPILMYHMAILMLVGIVTGVLTGLVAQLLLQRLQIFARFL
ncbi:MAG: Gx transporter family protein [Clostridiales bacterium]|nr:Gx transporter family protein [Clostridiales bacterium]